MGRIKQIGDYFGFSLELCYIGREKDKILKENKKVFIYPFTTYEGASIEHMEINIMRKKCLRARKNFLKKKREEEKQNGNI